MVETREILIESIVIPPERARATFTSEQDAELEASIRTHGFTVPILVAPIEGGKYLLIDGEHRVEIAKRLGMGKVPAVICEKDEKRIHLLNILANTARGSQNPVDVAAALKRAVENGASDEELAAATGHTQDWVRFYLALNDLPEHVKVRLRTGELKVGHIREALKLGVPKEIDAALQSAVIHNWTVEDLSYYVKRRIPEVQRAYNPQAKEPPPPPPTPAEAEELVNYATCMGCARNVDRKNMRMPMVCEDCYTLLKYVTSQLGEPKTAMQTIYKAYMFYVDAMAKTSPTSEFNVKPPEQAVTPSPPASPAMETSKSPPTEIDMETLTLARKLKALKEAGIL